MNASSGASNVLNTATMAPINATDGLAEAIREVYPEVDEAAFFANTAVDRIVPNQERR